MTNEWKTKPTECITVTNQNEYILAIDENGTSSNFEKVFEKAKTTRHLDASERYFTLTGVIITFEEFRIFKEKVQKIKEKYWVNNRWYNTKKNREECICFHSSDFRSFRNRRNAFRKLNDDNFNKFIEELSELINETDFKIISINFDLLNHALQYVTPENPYKFGMHMLFERYRHFLNSKRKTGIVVFESRGSDTSQKLDNYVHKETIKFLNTGITTFGKHDVSNFECIKGVYFNSKYKADSNYTVSFCAIELADIVSYPIYKRTRDDSYNGRDWQMVQKKLYNYPYYERYGLKFFP